MPPFHIDSIRNIMNPKPTVVEETPMLEEGKVEEKKVNISPKKIIHEYKAHDDEITRAYRAMKQGNGLLEEEKTIKEDDEPAVLTRMGAQIARQDKVKLGGKTPVDLHPTTTPVSAKDSNTIGMSKKGYKSVAKTTGEETINEVGKKKLQNYVQKSTDSTVPLALKGDDNRFYNRLSGINKAKMRIKGAIPPNRNIGKVKLKVKKENVDEGIIGHIVKTAGKLAWGSIARKGLGIEPGQLSYIRNQQNIAANIRSKEKAHAREIANLKKTHAAHVSSIIKAKPIHPKAQVTPAPAIHPQQQAAPKQQTTAAASPQSPKRKKTVFRAPSSKPQPSPQPSHYQPINKSHIWKEQFLQEAFPGHHGFNYPDQSIQHMSHEEHLDRFIHHHNQGTIAKEAGKKTDAKVHFRARDKHMVHYVNKAPHEHFKHLDHEKVKEILQIKEGFKPIQKIRKLLQKRNIRSKMDRWQVTQKQMHQQDNEKK